tara:strand:- start:2216 stop:2710 length:495 start_codon:yes stop_codon:yes gene_type:complete
MIDGTYSVLYIKWEDEFLPIGCLTSDSFSEDIEMLDSTTRDNAGWKTSTPTNQSYNLSFEGIVKNTNFNGGDFTKISLDRLRILKRSRILIEWKTQDNNSIFEDSGFGYITSLSKSASTDEFISFSANIEGYGAPYSTGGLGYTLGDGNSNTIQDGNNNEIITG